LIIKGDFAINSDIIVESRSFIGSHWSSPSQLRNQHGCLTEIANIADKNFVKLTSTLEYLLRMKSRAVLRSNDRSSQHSYPPTMLSPNDSSVIALVLLKRTATYQDMGS
jgi:hypothetical protein